jgi:hypothetical protein
MGDPFTFTLFESLMNLHKSSIDWDILEEYFSLFKLSGLFAELKRKYFYVE